MNALLLSVVGHASGHHTGIPTTGVEGLGPPLFQTEQTGWSAQVEDGIVRVYVGRDLEATQDWMARMQSRLIRFDPQPYMEMADEAYGDGETLLLLRDGNVGIVVHTKANALHWATLVQSAIVDEPEPWPEPCHLEQDELGWWRLVADTPAQLSYIGGIRHPDGGLVFVVPPTSAIVWDHWGRSTRSDFGDPTDPVNPSDGRHP